MGGGGPHWRTVEHTADLAIEVEAPSLPELFLGGAHGLTGVLLGAESGAEVAPPPAPASWRRLALEAPDREALLVDWLRELLFVQLSEGLVFAGAEIEELADTRLVARVGFARAGGRAGAGAGAGRAAAVQRELKGVTYHDLTVRRRGGGWYARVVFDL
jgi:SHS2 domain-containing protein